MEERRIEGGGRGVKGRRELEKEGGGRGCLGKGI